MTWLVERTACSAEVAEQAYFLAQAQPLTAERFIQSEALMVKGALVEALGGLLDGGKAVSEALAALNSYDIDVILEAALMSVEQRLYNPVGATDSRVNFYRRDKILQWLVANRRGINFGRDMILPELGRLLATEN